jgi:UDP-glucuronate 4-epimerase
MKLKNSRQKLLITGGAGFIGYHLTELLAQDENYEIVSVDNLNDYYDVDLKLARLKELGVDVSDLLHSRKYQNLSFIKMDISDKESIKGLFGRESFDYVINLAAQAGVRYSLANPGAYIDSNVYGFLNILESCRERPVKHLVFASSSSVYGLNEKTPSCEDDKTDSPVSLYGCTKKMDELMAHAYSYLFGIPCTGVRLFTVYGPWGRPDMAYFDFTNKIYRGDPITLFNSGMMSRDFTYVSDAASALADLVKITPDKFSVYNIGNSSPVSLIEFVETLESVIGKKAIINKLPMQPGDVEKTYADTKHIEELGIRFQRTPLREGLDKFVKWYNSIPQQNPTALRCCIPSEGILSVVRWPQSAR